MFFNADEQVQEVAERGLERDGNKYKKQKEKL